MLGIGPWPEQPSDLGRGLPATPTIIAEQFALTAYDAHSPALTQDCRALDDEQEDCIPGVPVSTAIIERRPALRLANDGVLAAATRDIAGEVPVSFTYNGLAHAVMMATPADLEDFAVGFTLTQEIVQRAGDIGEIELRALPIGFLVRMTIPGDRFKALTERRRNLVGQTGCGLCGVVELTQAVHALRQIEEAPHMSRDGLFRALHESRSLQKLNAATGAMHAAFFVTPDGAPLLMREDVGRHNALDKLIGALAREGRDASGGYILLTSRCSYELVEKAVIARAPALVTISAPTTLAIARAEATHLTLIALARHDSVLVFNDPFGVFAGN